MIRYRCLSEHDKMIEYAKSWIRKNASPSSDFLIYYDHTPYKNHFRPPVIGSSIPDVYAISIDKKFEILCEAETGAGLESLHTEKQIIDFLRYCNYRNSIFILITNWNLVARGYSIIKSIKEEYDFNRSKFSVIYYCE